MIIWIFTRSSAVSAHTLNYRCFHHFHKPVAVELLHNQKDSQELDFRLCLPFVVLASYNRTLELQIYACHNLLNAFYKLMHIRDHRRRKLAVQLSNMIHGTFVYFDSACDLYEQHLGHRLSISFHMSNCIHCLDERGVKTNEIISNRRFD